MPSLLALRVHQPAQRQALIGEWAVTLHVHTWRYNEEVAWEEEEGALCTSVAAGPQRQGAGGEK
eukprot:4095271-Pyramimonas_sp.AAC.1